MKSGLIFWMRRIEKGRSLAALDGVLLLRIGVKDFTIDKLDGSELVGKWRRS